MAVPSFKRVEELFHRAVALDPAGRPQFLDEACAGDADLRAAVEELLRHDHPDDATASFLDSPVAAAAEQHRPAPAGTAWPAVLGYELIEELGRGGMGVVYKARQTSLGRVVALKMLHAHAAVAPEQLARFRAEAEALARLNHPNVVTIYDVGEHEGRPYFALEYVAGPSLAQWLAGRPQEPRAAAQLIETVARAVQAVHECGIIHRDLKPANILLAFSDASQKRPAEQRFYDASLNEAVPKITDFGLAKDQAADRKLTQLGTFMGTPSYMAPEQARPASEAVGPAADIYALGVVLYEMLTGRPPFDADNPADTILQLLHDEPLSPSSLRPRLPRDLVTICLKCLEKSPRRRYARALDLAEDLGRFLAGKPVRARPVGRFERAYRWCRRRPLVAGLLALSSLLAGAFVITVLVFNARLEKALAKSEKLAEAERVEIVRLNVEVGVMLVEGGDHFVALLRFTEALSLDRRDRVWEQNHRTRIATTLRQCPRLARLKALGRVPPGQACTVWDVAAVPLPDRPLSSPDGRCQLTRQPAGGVQVRDTTTGLALTPPLRHGGRPAWAGFSRSGRQVVTVSEKGTACLWELPHLPTPKEPAGPDRADAAGPLSPSHALPSPDGRLTLVCTDPSTANVRDAASGAALTPPLRHPEPLRYAAWSADGSRLLTSDGRAARVWDVRSGELLAPPLNNGHAVERVYFTADGDRACLVQAGGVSTWDLSPDTRPAAELVALAEVLAAAYIDENQVRQSLTEERLHATWKGLHE
jgi:serine/threonine protein kinase